MGVGACCAFLLLPTSKVIRDDGTQVASIKSRGFLEELKSNVQAFGDWKLLIMVRETNITIICSHDFINQYIFLLMATIDPCIPSIRSFPRILRLYQCISKQSTNSQSIVIHRCRHTNPLCIRPTKDPGQQTLEAQNSCIHRPCRGWCAHNGDVDLGDDPCEEL